MSDNISAMALAVCAIKPGLQVEDLCDDVLLEIFRRLSLYDLMRVELICTRWRILQAQVLREKTRLALLDDCGTKSGHINSAAAVPPCTHLTRGNLCNDVLPVRSLYHLVSLLYFLAPRMPNVKTLWISIHWIVPEQLAQVLAKFHKVQCLTLYGKPTQNAVEWTAVQKVLTAQYWGLRHFVSNYHLAPEKKFDPMFTNAINKLDAAAYWLGEKIYLTSQAAFSGDNFIFRAILKIERILDKWFPRQTNGPPREDDAHDEQDNALQQAAAPPQQTHSFWGFAASKIVSWVMSVFDLIMYLFSKLKFNKSPVNEDLYWEYLARLEELHIPGHFNRVNKRSYTFSPTIGNDGSMKRFTIGDTKILHCCSTQLFQSLSFLYITDVWDRNYAYLYEKLPQCQQLTELRIHFIGAQEESTLDLLDFFEEGCLKNSVRGFLQLHTLVIDFPLASLSRRYYLKMRSIFPAITSISINFSRIKPERRMKLIYFLEHRKIGFPLLNTLHILSNGNADFDWLAASHKIITFNLTSIQLTKLRHLKVFFRIARCRADRASMGFGLDWENITLEVNSRQLARVKARYVLMLATHWPGVSFEENLHIRTVQQPRALAMMHDISLRGIETV